MHQYVHSQSVTHLEKSETVSEGAAIDDMALALFETDVKRQTAESDFVDACLFEPEGSHAVSTPSSNMPFPMGRWQVRSCQGKLRSAPGARIEKKSDRSYTMSSPRDGRLPSGCGG